jgi:hypothetical protein
MQNLQVTFVTVVTLVKGQRSNSGECARIIVLCLHFLNCYVENQHI